jgi:hypothetical protein
VSIVKIESTLPVTRTPRLRVLFDETHSQAWSVRPEVAAAMQPQHPADASYAAAAQALANNGAEVLVRTHGALDDGVLDAVDVLVLAHPSDPKWEATVSGGSPVFTPGELSAIGAFVTAGGGLLVLGETEQSKYGTNVTDLLAPYGLSILDATVQDYTNNREGNPTWVQSRVPAAHATTRDVADATFYRSGVVAAAGDQATIVLETHDTATHPTAGLLAVATSDNGRVAVFADSDLFGDDCFDSGDHRALWHQTVMWLGLPSVTSSELPHRSHIQDSTEWADLHAAVSVLRGMQNPDGSLDPAHDAATATATVTAVSNAVAALAPHFEHETAYLTAVQADLAKWIADGFGKPDFSASLAEFRPELVRHDGIEHLVVFPMYTPNGSSETRFEALLVRVPWPAWLAALEQTRFNNKGFVPVHMLAWTAGYDSECAVLFPETVSIAGKASDAPNSWGAILCDREAARFQRVTGAAVRATKLDLPIDGQALIADLPTIRDTFVLWDLIHDRVHMHGELPFDPFMVRKRLPFWMYALEELRCDVTTFCSAADMLPEFPFAQNVMYAVILDRMLRFPATGSRVRNYDGLGGQVLFGFLHQRGVVVWRDNTLEIDWVALPAAMNELRNDIEALYRTGISSSRVRYWLAAHDLVSTVVSPNLASKWVAGSRPDISEDEPKAWIDNVLDDEFPLNQFFLSLQRMIAPELEASAKAAA